MPSKQVRAAMMSSIRDPLCLYTFYENVIARVQGLHGDVSFCGTPSFFIQLICKPHLKIIFLPLGLFGLGQGCKVLKAICMVTG